MKLVKLLSKPLSSVAGIVGIPNAEDVVIPSSKDKVPETPKKQKSLLISDDRFTLLQHAGVKTYLIKDFSEVAVRNIGDFDKKITYVIADIVKPSKFESFDPAEYEVGDYVFVYEEGPKHPGEPPKMAKPAPGYSFTPQEYVDALNEYNTAMKEYTKELEEYETAVKEFITTGEASYEEYGWLVRIVSETQYYVIADFSFETTKDTAQFGVMGKLPKEVATKVTKALGGFAADDSIRGLTVAEIIEKALGLEVEEELVGQLLPPDEEEEEDPTPTPGS